MDTCQFPVTNRTIWQNERGHIYRTAANGCVFSTRVWILSLHFWCWRNESGVEFLDKRINDVGVALSRNVIVEIGIFLDSRYVEWPHCDVVSVAGCFAYAYRSYHEYRPRLELIDTFVVNLHLHTGKIRFTMYWNLGTAVAQWLSCCATNRKVAGSIPAGVIGIFHWHIPSDRSMALGTTQLLTEMSTRSIFWG
jgi:hypothetical protein